MDSSVVELFAYTVPYITNDKLVALISILDVLNIVNNTNEARKLITKAVEGTQANRNNRVNYFKNTPEYSIYSDLLKCGRKK